MFKEIPANKRSISRRKLVYGVGINDADYIVNPKINMKTLFCPFYSSWNSMIKRCFSEKYHAKKPTYKDCSACDEWLTFSNFKAWMIKQDWKGKHLDKDIVKTGNKIYSPETCIFVTVEVNSLLVKSDSRKGLYKLGVCFSNKEKKFIASCSVNGKQKRIGCFASENEASIAYKAFKYKTIINTSNKQKEPLKGYLKRIALEYKD